MPVAILDVTGSLTFNGGTVPGHGTVSGRITAALVPDPDNPALLHIGALLPRGVNVSGCDLAVLFATGSCVFVPAESDTSLELAGEWHP